MKDAEGNALDLQAFLIHGSSHMVDAMFMVEQCHRMFVKVAEALGRAACSVAVVPPQRSVIPHCAPHCEPALPALRDLRGGFGCRRWPSTLRIAKPPCEHLQRTEWLPSCVCSWAEAPIAISHPTPWATLRDYTARCIVCGGGGLVWHPSCVCSWN